MIMYPIKSSLIESVTEKFLTNYSVILRAISSKHSERRPQ